MRTVQRTYTLFGIAELEDEARQRAYTDWLAKGNDYPYASENCDTLEAFCNLFRIVCTNYRYDSCTYAYRFYTKHEADTEELSGVRLLAYLYNNFHAGLYKPKVYSGLRKIPVCRGIEPVHSVPYPSSLSLSALKSNSSSTA